MRDVAPTVITVLATLICGVDAPSPVAAHWLRGNDGSLANTLVPDASSRLLCGFRSPRTTVHTQGDQIVDATGKPLHLHGINLGNWLLVEGHMWHFEGGRSV